MIALRIAEEESAMLAQFGSRYVDYMKKTGRFLPPLRRATRISEPPER
jgi:protein-S-isoprenylcysteine O-methyltransferase Ste14